MVVELLLDCVCNWLFGGICEVGDLKFGCVMVGLMLDIYVGVIVDEKIVEVGDVEML